MKFYRKLLRNFSASWIRNTEKTSIYRFSSRRFCSGTARIKAKGAKVWESQDHKYSVLYFGGDTVANDQPIKDELVKEAKELYWGDIETEMTAKAAILNPHYKKNAISKMGWLVLLENATGEMMGHFGWSTYSKKLNEIFYNVNSAQNPPDQDVNVWESTELALHKDVQQLGYSSLLRDLSQEYEQKFMSQSTKSISWSMIFPKSISAAKTQEKYYNIGHVSNVSILMFDANIEKIEIPVIKEHKGYEIGCTTTKELSKNNELKEEIINYILTKGNYNCIMLDKMDYNESSNHKLFIECDEKDNNSYPLHYLKQDNNIIGLIQSWPVEYGREYPKGHTILRYIPSLGREKPLKMINMTPYFDYSDGFNIELKEEYIDAILMLIQQIRLYHNKNSCGMFCDTRDPVFNKLVIEKGLVKKIKTLGVFPTTLSNINGDANIWLGAKGFTDDEISLFRTVPYKILSPF